MVYNCYHNISKIKRAKNSQKTRKNAQKTRKKTRKNAQNYNLKNKIFRYIITK